MSMISRALRCSVASLLFASVPAFASAWDFENGDLHGWTNTGTAFWTQPTYGNNVAPRRPGESPGAQGNYWIGTYESHPSPTVALGRTQGDGPTGELLSDPFQINTATIDFLIGGGDDIVNERVSLLVKRIPGEPPPPRPDVLRHLPDGDYWTFLSSTGRNQEEMYRRVWDVRRWNGRTARILIVDNASGPWGHINADDFHVHPGLGTATVVQPLGTAVPVNSGDQGSATAYPVGGGTVVVQPPSNGTAQPAGPATAYPVGGAGGIVVQPPAQGRGPGEEGYGQRVQSIGPAQPVGPVTAYPVGGGNITVSPPSTGGGLGTATPVGRDPVHPAGPAASGHFQLIALQFVVNHQTRDDALESDGPGDEIMIQSDALFFSPDGRFVRQQTKSSGIFGAPDRWDFIAGSAVPGFSVRNDPGGLQTGDIYPRAIRPVRTNGDLPIVLWDGVLERGGDGVLIMPTVWEMEDRSRSPAQAAWDDGLVRARSLGLSVVRALNNTVEDNSSPILPNFIATQVFDNGNRPIGAAVHPPHFPWGPLPHDAGMRAAAIPLTYDKAMFFASRPATAISLNPTPGTIVYDGLPVPRGGIVMQFVDPPGNDGDYYLVMQLVQVP